MSACPGPDHCVNCACGGCIRSGCKRDRSTCPCYQFHVVRVLEEWTSWSVEMVNGQVREVHGLRAPWRDADIYHE